MSQFFQEFVRNLMPRFDLHKLLGVLAVLAGAFFLVRLGNAAVTRLTAAREGFPLAGTNRARTIATLLKSIIRYTVYFIASVAILGLFGVQTGGLLAGAGFVGLAVGFGAKNLIQDIITGFFIIFEDQFTVGDYITTAGVSGLVEEMGLRVTRLRDLGGQVHYVPNGKITQVTNYSRGSLQAVVDIGIAGGEDIDRAVDVLGQAGKSLAREWPDLIAAGPEVLGVVALSPSEITIRLSASVKPLHHWKVERELRKRAKEALDKAGIKLPSTA
ncbi:MAG TPA: mechanosensitive ion channel family protein [Bacillota bacterium]|nr:mechanosensitive ion channel family protein [Bacillota bacterium]